MIHAESPAAATLQPGDATPVSAAKRQRATSLQGLLAIALAATGGFGMSIAYAVYRFVQGGTSGGSWNDYDPYRYDVAARFLSRAPAEEILAADMPGFAKMGYTRVLALVYHQWAPDAVVGCVFNWVLWAASGLLLAPFVSVRKNARDLRVAFLVIWFLLPDAVEWTGTTGKEPLCVFLIAVSIWLAQAMKNARAVPTVLGAAVVFAVAWVGAEVRSALALLVVVPYAVVLERRLLRSRSVIPWSCAGAALALVVSLIGLGDVFGAGVSGEFAHAGHGYAVSTFRSGFSSDSVVARLGSSNPWLDLLAVPVRGLAHIVSPLHSSPFSLPLAQVAATGLLHWTSAALYTVLAMAVVLGYRWSRAEGGPRSPTDGVLLSTTLLALFTLGMTGFLNERYRSVVVPALLPLGVRCLEEEWRTFRERRLVALTAAAAFLGIFAYVALKFGL